MTENIPWYAVLDWGILVRKEEEAFKVKDTLDIGSIKSG
jgi:hypothetical protein